MYGEASLNWVSIPYYQNKSLIGIVCITDTLKTSQICFYLINNTKHIIYTQIDSIVELNKICPWLNPG